MKIISYNIHKNYNTFKTKFILKEIKQYLLQHDPDILFLQEIQEVHDQKERLKIESQLEYLADIIWPHYSYGKNAVYPNGHHGNAILSKFPILHWENIDLSTNRFEQRGLLCAEVKIGSKTVTLLNTHLNLLQSGRNLQSDKIVEKIRSLKTPWILMGDFNDWNSKLVERIETQLGVTECFRMAHQFTPPTFPCFAPILSLDRAFISGLSLDEARLLLDDKSKKLSDHLPIQITVSF